MSISDWVRRLGRGAGQVPALDQDTARTLMSELIAGEVSDLHAGAFAAAAQLACVNVEVLCGFLAAAQQRCNVLTGDGPAVVLPSYGNDGRRAPLTPLLALRLAQDGAPVLVHGIAGTGSGAIFRHLGLPQAHGSDDLHAAWARGLPAFVPIDALSPPLARLIERMDRLGPCHFARAVAAMLDPLSTGPGLRVVQAADTETVDALSAFAARTGCPLMLLRGVGSEPVADPRHLPRIDVWLRGRWRPELSCAARESALGEWPLLPRGDDAAATALYIQAVASGERPAPRPLERQVSLLLDSLAACKATAEQRP